MLDEVPQQFEFAGRQFNGLALTKHLSAAEIYSIRAEFVGAFLPCTTTAPVSTPKQGFDPRKQLHHLERLRQIVVRAEFEPDDLIDQLAFGGQHQDRSLDSLLPKISAHIQTTAVR